MSTAKSEDFNHGTKAQHVDLMRALHLMKTFSEADVREEWLPEQITLINDYSMELVCHNQSAAIFGMYEHKRTGREIILPFMSTAWQRTGTGRILA